MSVHRLLILAVCLAILPAGHAFAEPPGGDAQLVVDPNWPQKAASSTWGAMSGIAVDAANQVFLFHRSEPTVEVFRPDGTPVRSWSTSNPKGTHHVRIAPDGNVWTADFRRHVVEKYTPAGKLLLRLGTADQKGSDKQHFDGPTDMAILPDGEVFISDGYGNRRVVQFDKEGRFVKQWGGEGTAPGQFALPHAIVADSRGRLYVADRNNARVQVFNTDGKLLAVWDDSITPWGLAVTKNDEIWVCGSSRARQPEGNGWVIAPPPDQLLAKFNREGKLLLQIPLREIEKAPGEPGEVDWVHAVAVDSQGALYLGDIQGKRAQKYTLVQP